jgi:uncharacterized membrane protein YgcG
MISLETFRGRGIGATALAAVLTGLLAAPQGAILRAQQQPPPTTTSSATAMSSEAPESVKLSGDQLESLVAPIALYPDPLLAQCLVASTYPIDIVAAQQWLAKNTTLKGDALTKAAQGQDWDPSVQALVTLPEALKILSENIAWTEDLGDAVLAQQSEVMEAVQRLRAKAKDGGKLASTEQQTVETKVVEQKTVIEIQPTSTEVVYVPSYSPTVIWGAPYYPYPPMYYPPYYGGAWLGFGVGMAIGIGMAGGWGWGCGWGGNNDININNNNNFINNNNKMKNTNRTGNSKWGHNPQQRGGAPYKDRATANKYGGSARGDTAQARQGGAQNRQAQTQRSGGPSVSDRSAGGGSRGGGSGDFGGRGSGSSAGGGDFGGSNRAGSRDMGSSSRGGSSSSAFGGSSRGGGYSGSSARSSSSRGSSSMGSRGGGMSRGGGGRGGGGRR